MYYLSDTLSSGHNFIIMEVKNVLIYNNAYISESATLFLPFLFYGEKLCKSEKTAPKISRGKKSTLTGPRRNKKSGGYSQNEVSACPLYAICIRSINTISHELILLLYAKE